MITNRVSEINCACNYYRMSMEKLHPSLIQIHSQDGVGPNHTVCRGLKENSNKCIKLKLLQT